MKNKLDFPKAALFDFDGVVVDSFSTHFAAWKQAYKELFNLDELNFPHKELAGKSPVLISKYICEQIGQADKYLDYFNLKSELLHNSQIPPTLLPGVKEIQQYLQTQNIPHGIASNATREFVKNSVQQLELGFTTTFGVQDFKKPKPDPEAYITLAKALDISSEDYNKTWVFEDSITGTEAAKQAGMVPIGILTMNSEEVMKKAGSQLCFPTLLEAFQYLQKNFQ